MAGNIFGNLFRLSSYGESHGEAIGGVIDGCPSGLELDFEAIQKDLDRRKPGQSRIVTQRKEPDEVQFHSGFFEGKTTGTPIGFAIYNTNQNLKTTVISKILIDPLMQIMSMIKNTVIEIIEEEAEVLLERLQQEL